MNDLDRFYVLLTHLEEWWEEPGGLKRLDDLTPIMADVSAALEAYRCRPARVGPAGAGPQGENAMTIGDTLKKMMTENGLWPQDADVIISRLVAQEDALSEVLGEDAQGYPPQVLAAVWETTRHEVLTWMDAEKPKHFARPMFDDALMAKLKDAP